MYSQPRFGLITSQQVTGFLKATGSSDPDVLAAAKDQIAGPYRPLKWFGIWGMVTGALCTVMIVLAFIGIPVFIFGVWAFRREKKNRATIDAAYDEYIAKVAGLGAGSAQPLVPGEIRSVGLVVGLLVVASGALQAQFKQVPPEFHGDWVSAKATCDAVVRFRVQATSFTLMNGKDAQTVNGIEMAGPSYWGPDYSGIQAVAISEFEGDQPVTATFNFQEKKGAASVDYTELPANVQPAYAAQAARLKKLNLAQRFPLKGAVLKQCPVKGGASGQQAAGRSTAPVVAVEDFRITTSGNTRYAAVVLRVTNKRAEPLVLGYVQGSGIVTDDRGNRYMVSGPIRGIGEINASSFDPKFALQPGETRDARFEFAWNRQNQIFGTTFTLDMALRDIVPAGANQYTLGQERVFRVEGLTDMTAGATVSTASAPSTSSAAPSTGASSGNPAARPPADPCGPDPRCFFAGPFAATVTQVSTSKGSGYQFVKLNIRFTNLGAAPLILCYSGRSSTGSDDRGNRFGVREPQGLRGIGICAGGVADPQFALQAGASREASFEYATGIYGTTVLGTVWTVGFTTQELELLPGNQVQTKSEYLVSFRDLTDRAGAAPPTTTTAATTAPSGAASRPEGTACADKQWCDDAGIFVAQVTRVTPSRGSGWQLFGLNIKVQNMLEEPLILCIVSGSGLGTDEKGNRYSARSVKGIGTCTNSQFALKPGESRDIAIEYGSGIYRGTIIGVEWKADFTLQRLQQIPGNQIQTAGDYAVSFAALQGGGSTAGSAASSGSTSSTDDAASAAAAGAKGLLDKVFKKK